jgi:hypothetical protein
MCVEIFSHPLTSSGLIVGHHPVEVQSASLALKIFVFNNPETFLLCLEILYLILIACEQRESRIIVETEAKEDTALNLKKTGRENLLPVATCPCAYKHTRGD